MKAWPVLGISLIQVILLLAHWFLYHTWITFLDPSSSAVIFVLQISMLALSVSFVGASLLSFRYSNPLVVAIYRFAAVWMGFLNYLFWSACLSWLAWYSWVLSGLSSGPAVRAPIVLVPAAAACLASIYGIINARAIRVRRVGVALPGLPQNWRGRKAVLMSDLHLGNINRKGFSRRMVALAASLTPDIIFIPGDLFDGTKGDLDELVTPFKELAPPFGIYFSSGNHEEFADPGHYLDAVRRAGIRVLANERVEVDGLRIAGVPFGDSTSPIRMKAVLDGMGLSAGGASILLNHMPSRLPIVERAGVSLQLSGHTHGGQFFPFNVLTRRIFGKFTHGLHRFGELQVYTSTGAGTWGPPLRVGTEPEMVLLEFE